MKNTTITKPLQFLEDRIAVILALFIPVWIGIFLVLVIGLPLLPEEIARKVSPEPIHIMLAVLGSLVLCAVITILRMVRDVRDGKPKKILIYPFLIALNIIFLFYVLHLYAAVQLKMDTPNTQANLGQISRRLKYVYEEEHGSYPPQQDFRSLLETLGMNDSDFIKTRFYDIYSAEYHAPAGDSNDPRETIITIRTKWFVPESSNATVLFLRRDGSVGIERLKDIREGAAK